MTRRRHLFLAASLILLVAALAATPLVARDAQSQDGPLWLDDLDQAVAAARAHDAYIVVDLYADWCGWCKKLENEVFPAAEFRAFAEDKVLLKVSVEDGAEGTRLQQRHRAFNLPTTLLLDADLVRVGKVQGYVPASKMVAGLEAELTAWERLVAKVPEVVASENPSLQRSLADELHDRGAGRLAAQLYRGLLADATDATDAGTDTADNDAAWLHFYLADALRLAGDYEGAEASVAAARAATRDPDLSERLDLLAYKVAEDHGDCQGAKASLQHFLDAHPKSRLRTRMARTLHQLEQGRTELCA